MAEAVSGKTPAILDGTAQAEPALHSLTDATLTDVIEDNNGNLPAARYPRSSRELGNRFYVANPEAAGDMRAKLVSGEKFPTPRPNEASSTPDVQQGGVWDSGDTGGGARGKDTGGGK